MVFNVNGIVIKEMTAGETGKRILVITREHGKMLLSAPWVKKCKERNNGGNSAFFIL